MTLSGPLRKRCIAKGGSTRTVGKCSHSRYIRVRNEALKHWRTLPVIEVFGLFSTPSIVYTNVQCQTIIRPSVVTLIRLETRSLASLQNGNCRTGGAFHIRWVIGSSGENDEGGAC